MILPRLCGHIAKHVSLVFILHGAEIVKRGVSSISVIKGFYPDKELILSFLAALEALESDQLRLETGKERFDTGVVIAVSFSAHADDHVMLTQDMLVGRTGIQPIPIAVVQKADAYNSTLQGLAKSLVGRNPLVGFDILYFIAYCLLVMTNIRRYFQTGNLYFLTHVTSSRLPILVNNFDLLWRAINATWAKHQFDLIAWVVLPDHMHLLIDPLKCHVSGVMRKIKLDFSAEYRENVGLASGRVWQNRFWDHRIRDQEDFNRHVDYIHYNPVKHGLVSATRDYPHSSFREYRARGYYSDDWGVREQIVIDGSFGE